jgi:hypothetical protein
MAERTQNSGIERQHNEAQSMIIFPKKEITIHVRDILGPLHSLIRTGTSSNAHQTQ